jgi:hypothetical protein
VTTPQPWPDLIGLLVLVKQEIAEREPGGPYVYALPRVGASAADLDAAAARVGELDPEYREFLTFADGWPEFSLSTQLMGTSDLLGAVYDTAQDYLETTLAPADLGLDAARLLPVAVASEDKDVIVVGRPGTPLAGQVVWLAGEEVDRYPSFRAWFTDTLEHHRRMLDRLRATGTTAPPA